MKVWSFYYFNLLTSSRLSWTGLKAWIPNWKKTYIFPTSPGKSLEKKSLMRLHRADWGRQDAKGFKHGTRSNKQRKSFLLQPQHFHQSCLSLPMLISVALLVSEKQKWAEKEGDLFDKGCTANQTWNQMGILASHHWLYHSQLESVLLNFPLSFLILEVGVVGKESLSWFHQCFWISFFLWKN